MKSIYALRGKWVRIPRGPAAVLEEFCRKPLGNWEGAAER